MTLVVVTFAIYVQVGNHQFLNFDDNLYVTDNPHVSSGISGKNIAWAFSSVDAANWHPVTWLSHMIDAQLYGMNPRGHHLSNVIIHAASSLLLLLFLFRLTGSLWRSSFVAALFALHPLHVESVAWVAERKDVLSGFFWFLTLLLYFEFVTKRKPVLYLLTLLSFMFGLMSKPMLVTLPIVMLLLDFWPLDRYKSEEQGVRQLSGRASSLILEKIPFFVCSLLSGLITIYAQHTGGAVTATPIYLRIENALIAYVTYVFKTLWPHDLAVYYPMPLSFPLLQVIGSLLVLLFLSVTVIRVGRRYSYLTVGWFWFLITLLPVIGLIHVGGQSIADRYMYIPVIGLFIMVAWGMPDLARGVPYREKVLAIIAGAFIVASAAVTWHQIGYWRDSISLYRHTLQVTSGNAFIHHNLGVALAEKGGLDEAIREYREALFIKPNYADAHNNLGIALARKGFLDAAIFEFQETIRIQPDYVDAHNNLGITFARKGDWDGAIRAYQAALRVNPGFMKARDNLESALAYMRMR